jgi:acyl-CoA synthetase (NDP forming)
MEATRDLGSLLAPKSLALVGVSRTEGTPSRHLLANLLEYQFPGPFLLVNPSGEPIEGLASYRTVEELPEPVDLALVVVPAYQVPDTVAACAARGIPAAVVYSAGFADDRGPSGPALQRRLEEVIATTGIAVCGPNSEGFFSVAEGVPASFSGASALEFVQQYSADGSLGPEAGNIAIVGQSGGLGFSLFSQGLGRQLRFSYVISAGNEAGLTILDYIAFLLESPSTDVVLAYIEGLRDPERLAPVAARAMELGKHLVVAKVGRSDAARRAALSHTGHLAGEDRAYDAIFRRYGIVRVSDTEEMLDVAMALSWGKRRPGRRTAIVSFSGGSGVWMADAIANAGLEVPELAPDTQERLREVLPTFAATTNPVDITGASKLGPAGILAMVAEDPGIDALVLITTLRTAYLFAADRPALERLSQLAKPVVLYGYTEPTEEHKAVLRQLRLPFYSSPVRTARSLAALVALVPGASTVVSPSSGVVDRLRHAPPVLCEYEVKAHLAFLGLDTTAERLVTTGPEAVAAAGAIGFPVALKVQSPDLPHKQAAGGVLLGLASASEVEAGFAAITAQVALRHPGAAVHGVLVQEMVPVGLELIVGVDNTSGLGPMVLVGLGGSLAEVLSGSVMYPAPFGPETAVAMLTEVGATRILLAAGAPLDAVATLVSAVSCLAAEGADTISELDLNPVVVDHTTGRARIVDALLVTRSP